jgi:CO/xanthine dehydrogenase FAD-binding subunit
MNQFSYARADDLTGAINEVSRDETAKFIAGGTNVIDLIKENVIVQLIWSISPGFRWRESKK